jgi:DNA-binding transcriptional LysR family regulator
LRHLRYFVVAAEEENFRRAARLLHISQPPLSQQIARLESELGVKLFYRDHRAVRLTEAGRQFLPQAQRALAQADSALRHARAVGAGEVGDVVLGYEESVMYGLLPDVVRQLAAHHPNLRLSLRQGRNHELSHAVKRGDVDVAVVRTPAPRGGVRWETWSSERLVALLPVGHRLADDDGVALADMADEDFIMVPEDREPDYRGWIVGLCQRSGFTPRVRHGISGHYGIAGLVAVGLGVALVPETLARWLPPRTVAKQLLDVDERSDLLLATRPDHVSTSTTLLLESIRSVGARAPFLVGVDTRAGITG